MRDNDLFTVSGSNLFHFILHHQRQRFPFSTESPDYHKFSIDTSSSLSYNANKVIKNKRDALKA